jgi:SAM-dependent methyltransferase
MSERSREDWAERGKAWAKAAPQGKSRDDSFDRMLIAGAAIRPGEDVLDLASGTGNPAISIALSMEGRGSVTCTDLTFGMLETARNRARNLDLSIMRFVAADMCALPFAADSFDCVTCRFGIMFPADKVAAAAEALRVLKPGGRVAYMVWDAYEANPPFHVPRRAVAAFLGRDEGPPPSRHALSAPGTLKAILDGAGFERAEERQVGYDNAVADLDAYVTGGLKRSFAKDTEGMDEAAFAALKQAVMDAWAPYTREDGITYVPNRAVLALGWKAT